MSKTEKRKRAFGIHEWAAHTINIISGCENICPYSYMDSETFRFRKTTKNWAKEKAIQKKNKQKNK